MMTSGYVALPGEETPSEPGPKGEGLHRSEEDLSCSRHEVHLRATGMQRRKSASFNLWSQKAERVHVGNRDKENNII